MFIYLSLVQLYGHHKRYNACICLLSDFENMYILVSYIVHLIIKIMYCRFALQVLTTHMQEERGRLYTRREFLDITVL